MATALEAAFPLNSNWPAATVRSKLAESMIAVFDTPDLSGEDFSIQPYPAIAVYGPGGDLTLYAFDAGDTVTADDGGVSCIVVSGRRYKRSGEVVVRDAAISATTTAQPASPSFGDTYIVPGAPSGDDWASQAKTIATFTARGWLFRQPFVGMMVYVSDEDAIYHYDSNGDWIGGLPIGAIQDSSIPPKKLTYPFAILKVEDQRNDPPGSAPTVGTMYQVGTSPTGDFVGHTNEIARWNEGAAWEFIAPEEGDTIYRKDDATIYTYRSGAWDRTIAASGVQQIKKFGDSATRLSIPGGSGVSGPHFFDNGVTITSAPGKYLRISIYAGTVTAVDDVLVNYHLRFYRDSESSALVSYGGLSIDGTSIATTIMLIPVADTSSHTYRFAVIRTDTNNTGTKRFDLTGVVALVEELVILP